MAERAMRIVIADDQPLFAEGLKTILESRAPDIRVVAIATNGRDAVAHVRVHKPDLVLMDVRMPIMDGVEATETIHRHYPAVRVVMLTTFDDDEFVESSLMVGAIGYLLKNRPPAELIASIRAVRGGILQIDPAVSRSLIRAPSAQELHEDDFMRSLHSLTRREIEVLSLLVRALGNAEIAERLHVADQTVRNYISSIYFKLQIVNRAEILRHYDKIRYFLKRALPPD